MTACRHVGFVGSTNDSLVLVVIRMLQWLVAMPCSLPQPLCLLIACCNAYIASCGALQQGPLPVAARASACCRHRPSPRSSHTRRDKSRGMGRGGGRGALSSLLRQSSSVTAAYDRYWPPRLQEERYTNAEEETARRRQRRSGSERRMQREERSPHAHSYSIPSYHTSRSHESLTDTYEALVLVRELTGAPSRDSLVRGAASRDRRYSS